MTATFTRLLLAGVLLLLTACGAASTGTPAPAPAPAADARVPWPTGLPAAEPVTAPAPTVTVSTAAQLQAALDTAAPGTAIAVADGTYEGEFVARASGTAEAPIWLFGSANAVLRGPGTEEGYVLHLDRTSHWRVLGLGVRDGRKGVMVDGTTHSVLQDLTVTSIGEEAVHLRTHSTDNVVRGLRISGTGLRTERFGEGIYVGSAVSNWGEISGGQPDRSDRNVVVGNDIRDTTAEAVDIKEGTTGGVLADNTFDGAGLTGDPDSWVDVKGNGWLIQANRGTTAEQSGFQVNEEADGWGRGNTFDANTADVDGPGYGYELVSPTDDPSAGNRVTCTNTATGAAGGLTNTTCA